MAKFVLMIHGGETPEDPSQAVMDRWMAWLVELGEAVVDMGAPFGASARSRRMEHRARGAGRTRRRVIPSMRQPAFTMPFVKAKGCPGLNSGGSLKVYEAVQMG